MFEKLADLAQAIREGKIDPSTLQAFVDINELYVYGANGDKLFDGVVTPENVAEALGIEDVNQV